MLGEGADFEFLLDADALDELKGYRCGNPKCDVLPIDSVKCSHGHVYCYPCIKKHQMVFGISPAERKIAESQGQLTLIRVLDRQIPVPLYDSQQQQQQQVITMFDELVRSTTVIPGVFSVIRIRSKQIARTEGELNHTAFSDLMMSMLTGVETVKGQIIALNNQLVDIYQSAEAINKLVKTKSAMTNEQKPEEFKHEYKPVEDLSQKLRDKAHSSAEQVDEVLDVIQQCILESVGLMKKRTLLIGDIAKKFPIGCRHQEQMYCNILLESFAEIKVMAKIMRKRLQQVHDEIQQLTTSPSTLDELLNISKLTELKSSDLEDQAMALGVASGLVVVSMKTENDKFCKVMENVKPLETSIVKLSLVLDACLSQLPAIVFRPVYVTRCVTCQKDAPFTPSSADEIRMAQLPVKCIKVLKDGSRCSWSGFNKDLNGHVSSSIDDHQQQQ